MFPFPFSFVAPTASGLADIDNVYSMEFDGVSSRYDLGTQPIVTGVFSISMWVKRNSTSSGDSTQVLIGKDNRSWSGQNLRVFNIFFKNITGQISFWVSSTGTYSGTYRVDTSTAINDTNWHNIVFLNKGDGQSNEVYVDGVEASYTAQGQGRTTLFNTTGIRTAIGGDSLFGTDYNFNGKLDEVAFFDYALDADQVEEIYNATSTGKTADLSAMATPPVAWYRMGD